MKPEIRIMIANRAYTGRAITIPSNVISPSTLAECIRDPDTVETVEITCPEPTEVYEYIGLLHPEMSIRITPALAAAARSRGLTAPQDTDLISAREKLSEISVSEMDLTSTKERCAELLDEEERLEEQVAVLRGRLCAEREMDADVTETECELRAIIQRLVSLQTDRIAVEQKLSATFFERDEDREKRLERLRLEDRIGNLSAAARRHLANKLEPTFERLIEEGPIGNSSNENRDGIVEALAVARLARTDAPIVLNCDLFESAREAANWLRAPVIRIGR